VVYYLWCVAICHELPAFSPRTTGRGLVIA
jgi:hypothetical protein